MSAARSFKQELVGVFGFPVAENPTQAMIEPAFAALGLDWRYLTVEVRPEQLADAVRGARAMNWRGFNCTIPHKIAVIPHLDQLSQVAEAIGAVNCVVARDGRLIGDNTDGKGFLQSLRSLCPIPGLNVTILGAGGAARAVAVELACAGAAKLTVVNRTGPRGQELARDVQARTGVPTTFEKWEGEYPVPADVDVLVNATSIGLYPDLDGRPPVDFGHVAPSLIVCDVIPNPPHTKFLLEAELRGLKTLDGLGMLVHQGVIGIALWTGLAADPELMRTALRDALGA